MLSGCRFLTIAGFTAFMCGQSMAQTPCVDGFANGYPCDKVDLWHFMPIDDLGGASNLNDIWGWTDALSGREFALVGKNNGTAFVEVTDPETPVFLGVLPTHTNNSLWRDIKVFADHCFIVSEAPSHGMQVFDLTRLLTLETDDLPLTFENDAHYDLFGRAHNIVINEETGFAYAVGSDTFSGGLHIVDVSDPLNPVIAGDFSLDGYTHDAQAVIYQGPDTVHCGKEIVFAANENSITIVDVEQKLNTHMLGRLEYENTGYAHQCWLTEDHRFLLLGDELDELQGLAPTTRTFIFDVQNLEEPFLLGIYDAESTAIDHNLYVRWNQVYQSNYRSGLRILDAGFLEQGILSEAGFFDTQPDDDNPSFQGSWSNYCYFNSGTVILTDMFDGLFVVKPRIATVQRQLTAYSTTSAATGHIYLSYNPEAFDVLLSDLPVGVGAVIGEPQFPGILTYDLVGIETLAPGNYTFTLTVSHDGEVQLFDVALNKVDALPEGVFPVPYDTEGCFETLSFEWFSTIGASSFVFEMATDEGLEDLVVSTVVPATSFEIAPDDDLFPPSTYFWRVSAVGACSQGFESPVMEYCYEGPTFVSALANRTPLAWPVPCDDVLYLRCEKQANSLNYAILSVTGRQLVEGVLLFSQGVSTLDTRNLATGVYLLKLSTGEALRFIKQ